MLLLKDFKVVYEHVHNDQRSPNIVKSVFYHKTYSSESSSVMSISFQLFQIVENIKAEIRLCFPETSEDEQYLKEFFRTSIDLAKMLKTLEANALVL